MISRKALEKDQYQGHGKARRRWTHTLSTCFSVFVPSASSSLMYTSSYESSRCSASRRLFSACSIKRRSRISTVQAPIHAAMMDHGTWFLIAHSSASCRRYAVLYAGHIPRLVLLLPHERARDVADCISGEHHRVRRGPWICTRLISRLFTGRMDGTTDAWCVRQRWPGSSQEG